MILIRLLILNLIYLLEFLIVLGGAKKMQEDERKICGMSLINYN